MAQLSGGGQPESKAGILLSPSIQADAASPSLVSAYGKLPLSFEANQGQSDPRAKFISRGEGYSMFFTNSSVILSLGVKSDSRGSPKKTPAAEKTICSGIAMELVGAHPGLSPIGVDPLTGKVNYFIGNDPAAWRRNIPTFLKVKYSGVYPGVDLVYYGNQQHLEYDFVVAPGADPSPLKLHFSGVRKITFGRDGNLVLKLRDGGIGFQKPFIYQLQGSRKQPVEGRFTLLSGNTVGFRLGRYDRARTLVIDPVLSYSTFLGGGGYQSGRAIAVDAAGDAYVTGETNTATFPMMGDLFNTALQLLNRTTSIGFVTKFDPAGAHLIFSTYLGGSGNDTPNSIALDASGNAYVAGSATSADFPVTAGAFQTVNNAGSGNSSAFLSKINSAGTQLVYSTYLGGSTFASASGVAVDSAGNAYVAGSAWADFPLAGSFASCPGAFVSKINASGTALIYSTCLSLDSTASAGSIAVDTSGEAFVGGSTSSTSLPVTSGAFQMTNKTTPNTTTGFVAKLNASGSGLMYASYIGGSVGDSVSAIAIDSAGSAYLTGSTKSQDLPVTSGALQTTYTAGAHSQSGFVSKVNPDGSSLAYSTYLGGSAQATGGAIALDAVGDAWVDGEVFGPGFPVTGDALQKTNLCAGQESAGCTHAFLAELNPLASALVYSTVLGGSVNDAADGLALDNAGGVYLTGFTSSPDFPITTGAFEPGFALLPEASGEDIPVDTSENVFISKFALSIALAPTTMAFAPQAVGVVSTPQTATLNNPGGTALNIDSIEITGNFSQTNTCGSTLAARSQCTISVTFDPTDSQLEYGTLSVAYDGAGSPQTVALSGTGFVPEPFVTLSQNSLSFPVQPVGSSSAPVLVNLTNTGTALLTISSITVSGDFSQTNTCGTDIAVGATCSLFVTFSPTTSGDSTGVVNIVDNALASPQQIPLDGTGGAVALSTSSGSLASPSAGTPATAQIQLSPTSGFSGTVNLTCQVAYLGQGTAVDPPTCSLTPAQVQIGSAPVASTLTVSTTPPASAAYKSGRSLTTGALAAVFFFGIFPRRRKRGALLFGLLAIGSLGLTFGCGGGSQGNPMSSNPGATGTTRGHYRVTVTATSGTVTSSIAIPFSLQ